MFEIREQQQQAPLRRDSNWLTEGSEIFHFFVCVATRLCGELNFSSGPSTRENCERKWSRRQPRYFSSLHKNAREIPAIFSPQSGMMHCHCVKLIYVQFAPAGADLSSFDCSVHAFAPFRARRIPDFSSRSDIGNKRNLCVPGRAARGLINQSVMRDAGKGTVRKREMRRGRLI